MDTPSDVEIVWPEQLIVEIAKAMHRIISIRRNIRFSFVSVISNRSNCRNIADELDAAHAKKGRTNFEFHQGLQLRFDTKVFPFRCVVQSAVWAGVWRLSGRVEILVIAANGARAAPTAIQALQFPGVNLQLAVVKRVIFALQIAYVKIIALGALFHRASAGMHGMLRLRKFWRLNCTI